MLGQKQPRSTNAPNRVHDHPHARANPYAHGDAYGNSHSAANAYAHGNARSGHSNAHAQANERSGHSRTYTHAGGDAHAHPYHSATSGA